MDYRKKPVNSSRKLIEEEERHANHYLRENY